MKLAIPRPGASLRQVAHPLARSQTLRRRQQGSARGHDADKGD